jgi:SAM-dependent methyltransferase
MSDFKDHFSGHAADYAAYRPGYPPELFDFLITLPAERRTAWDCATGNGQAALGIADHFEKVIATDASPQQLAHAHPHPRVEYRVAPAERSGLEDGSIDLVTVAQGLHWFDFDRFYDEARRVLAPGGALAVWTYNLARVTPEIDAVIDRLAHQEIAAWWPPERRWVDEEYRTIPFPFAEVEAPFFEFVAHWPLDRLVLYMRTWSCCQRFLKETGRDPMEIVREDLEAAWGDPQAERQVSWPVFLRAGRV